MDRLDERAAPIRSHALRRLLPDSATESKAGIEIGGCNLETLADRFGTPLYVFDESTLRTAARTVQAAFDRLGARVSFASKACDTVEILRVFRDEGLDLDVVSEGELVAGLRAGFEPKQMHLHGNYKTDDELIRAVRLGLHAVVIDNIEELRRLDTVCASLEQTVRVMLRISLSLEARTHPHLQTSGRHSKFGFFRGSPEEAAALHSLGQSRRLRLYGLHAHLGSQIDNASLYSRCAEELIALARHLLDCRFNIREISIGGGWSVPYTPTQSCLHAEQVAHALEPSFARAAEFRPAVEPGRALVARAAVAVYRTGSVKVTDHGRIVTVDGGMGDNPRPALYAAQYTAFAPGRPSDVLGEPADVAGRYCESGDILARNVVLPDVQAGDLICIPMAGAYHVAMFSSYNRIPPPPVVLVRVGIARLIVRRGVIDDLFEREDLNA